VTVSSASVGGQGDVLTASLLVNAPADLQVVGMTIDSSVAAYVSTIQVDGTMLFDVRTDLAPTGSMIKTTPMSLSGSGTVNIDKIDFADTITNQGTPSLSGTAVGITLHLEDGSTVPFKIGL